MPDIVAVTLDWTLGDRTPASSVAKVLYELGADGDMLAQLAEAAYTGWDDGLKANFNNTVVLTRATAQIVVPDDGRLRPTSMAFEFTDGDIPGTRSGTALPFFNAAVLSYHASVPGRRYINRMYFPPLDEGEVGADGEITVGRRNSLRDDFMTWIGSTKNATTPDGEWVGINFVDEEPWLVSATVRVDKYMGTMRSRMVPPATR